MRTHLALCLFLLAAPAAAQESTPVVEVSGGYSVLPEDSWDGEEWWSGWLASGSVSVTRWFGVAAEVGTNYYSARYSFDGQEFEYSVDRLFAGLGPRFVARGRRVSGFGHVLVGVENRFTENLFAFQAGGGADVWLTRAMGVRAGIDGRASYYDDDTYGTWRLQAGVVLALGSR